MSDLISRQAAIDTLGSMQTYKLFEGDDLLLIDQSEAQIKLMMLPPAQQWIPVSERLPNEDEMSWNSGVADHKKDRMISDRVLAIDQDGFARTGYFMRGMQKHTYNGKCKETKYDDLGVGYWEFGEHYQSSPEQWVVGTYWTPVAWMPLPEPYKGKDGEEK